MKFSEKRILNMKILKNSSDQIIFKIEFPIDEYQCHLSIQSADQGHVGGEKKSEMVQRFSRGLI
jgi:hypothetical protein